MFETKSHVISFSGGETSGMMLRLLMDKNPKTFDKDFTVLFCNTGKEHDKTLDFVHDVETRWGVRIYWLEYCRVSATSIDPMLVPDGRKRINLIKQQSNQEETHWFKVVSYETAKRSWQYGPFDEFLTWVKTLPNVRSRSCSAWLKIRTMDKFLAATNKYARHDYIGIRSDEAHRSVEILAASPKFIIPEFPLIDANVNKNDVRVFWDSQQFKLEIPNLMGNCDLCFLKAGWKLRRLAKDFPASAQWWKQQEDAFSIKLGESATGARFRLNLPYSEIIADANHPEFAFMDESEEDIACSCSTGGYRVSQIEED